MCTGLNEPKKSPVFISAKIIQEAACQSFSFPERCFQVVVKQGYIEFFGKFQLNRGFIDPVPDLVKGSVPFFQSFLSTSIEGRQNGSAFRRTSSSD
jgi:hypothetical protein